MRGARYTARTYIFRVGLCVVSFLTRIGNAKASNRGNGQQVRHHAFFIPILQGATKRKPRRLKGGRHQSTSIHITMKKYVKPAMIAKNAPTGSYAAGCGAGMPHQGHASAGACKTCECRQ